MRCVTYALRGKNSCCSPGDAVAPTDRIWVRHCDRSCLLTIKQAGAACLRRITYSSCHAFVHAQRQRASVCLPYLLHVMYLQLETLTHVMAVKSVGRLQRLKVTSLLFVLLGRACCCMALVADDSTTRRHRGPTEHHRDAAADQDAGGPALSQRADPRQVRWAKAAYEHVLGVDCQRSVFSTQRECSDVQRIDRRRWNVYLADPQLPQPSSGSDDRRRRRRRLYLRTVLPDGPIGDSGRYHRVDGVVVLDPYPDANFGHLVIVFHVTIAASSSWCHRRDGFLIGKQSSLSSLSLSSSSRRRS